MDQHILCQSTESDGRPGKVMGRRVNMGQLAALGATSYGRGTIQNVDVDA